jgi:hypothetical protein
MLRWIAVIRDRFVTNVIRRTLSSVDCDNKPISGLIPYIASDLVLNLYPNEMTNLENIADKLAENKTGGGSLFGSGKVSDCHC